MHSESPVYEDDHDANNYNTIEHCNWGSTEGYVGPEEDHTSSVSMEPSQMLFPCLEHSPPVFRITPTHQLSLSLGHLLREVISNRLFFFSEL